jgi:hypothetical protein
LSERTHGSPTLVAKDLAGGQLNILNVRQIKRINRHPGNRNEDIGPENISDAEYWVDRNGDLDCLTDGEDDWEVENKSEIVLDTSVRDSEPQGQGDVSAAPDVPGLILPTLRSKKWADMVLIMVGTMETRRNKVIKKK